MSAKVTLYFHGSEPGGLNDIPRSFKFGDSYEFTPEMAEILLRKRPQSWWTKEEYDTAMESRIEDTMKNYKGIFKDGDDK